jgi:hypothetical protein
LNADSASATQSRDANLVCGAHAMATTWPRRRRRRTGDARPRAVSADAVLCSRDHCACLAARCVSHQRTPSYALHSAWAGSSASAILTTGLYWVASAFNVDSDAWGPIWGVPATLGLAASLALFFGAGALIAMHLWTNDVRRIAVDRDRRSSSPNGCAATSSPASRGCCQPMSGRRASLISQLASIIGAYGLSLLTLLIAATPAALADRGQSAGRRFAPSLGVGIAHRHGVGVGRAAHCVGAG